MFLDCPDYHCLLLALVRQPFPMHMLIRLPLPTSQHPQGLKTACSWSGLGSAQRENVEVHLL